MNFQANRVLTYGESAGRIHDIKDMLATVRDYDDWYVGWLSLAHEAEAEGRFMNASYAYRMAEFFLKEDHKEKLTCYKSFLKCFNRATEGDNFTRHEVPYQGSTLPVMYLRSQTEKAIIVAHGGYDSFMEEFYLTVKQIPKAGYSVILFEGPGQGTALKRGLKFTHEWEKPVKSILDYFSLVDVTLLGISWGGYLALRAAAFEPRISRVIAYDVCFDGLEVMTRPMPQPIRNIFKLLISLNAQRLANALVARLRKRSLLLDWAVAHGMYITGTRMPIDFYQALSLHTMKAISHLVKQDVLLLAGEKDHYIPTNHYYRQKEALTGASSVVARLFTETEGGEQHCQVGNHLLAVNEMISWLDGLVVKHLTSRCSATPEIGSKARDQSK